MKKQILFFLAISFITTATTKAQPDPDSLLEALQGTIVSEYDKCGWLYFYPDAEIQPGQMFTMYEQVFGEDEHNSMQLYRQYHDEEMGITGYYYQQYYDEILVEAAQVSEHANEDGHLVWALGKVAGGLEMPEGYMTGTQAMDYLMDELPDEEHYFAWEDEGWEQQLKSDADDPDATHYPEGELLFALDEYTRLDYLIPADKYRLAWRFDVRCLDPDFHRAFFVDAQTGEVFNVRELRPDSYGTCQVHNHGQQDVDTRVSGSGDYILWSDDSSNVHTKYRVPGMHFNSVGDIFNYGSNAWGQSHIGHTTPHWFATETWGYFNETFNWNGMDSSVLRETRLWIDTFAGNANYGPGQPGTQVDYIRLGGSGSLNNGLAPDVVAHEYTHGIDEHASRLLYEYESGALDESFADILGNVVEIYIGNTYNPKNFVEDWTLGEDVGVSRSLEDPNLYWQPHTYEDTANYWYDLTGCANPTPGNDNCGVHTNSGVGNYWFYLLAKGGSGINGNGYQYNVGPISGTNALAVAAKVAFRTLVTLCSRASDYRDAARQSISIARNLYNYGTPCGFEDYQVEKAWVAVGVIDPDSVECLIPNTPETAVKADQMEPEVYPNPASDQVQVNFQTVGKRTIRLLSPTGKIVSSRVTNNRKNTLDVSGLPRGVYYLHTRSEFYSHTSKFVIW